jgi:hypothetical protein
MLLFLSLRLAATIQGFLSTYMPTNILVRHLRTHLGPGRAIPAALVLVPAYLFAASMATTLIERSGPGWLNLLALTCIWNAMKFAAVAAVGFASLAKRVSRRMATLVTIVTPSRGSQDRRTSLPTTPS